MNEELHIGELIRNKLKEDGHSVSWFAKKMNCDRTNVYKIFHKPYIDALQLLRISLILDHDFFTYYSQCFKIQKDVDDVST
jgi:plasmid maintenance system antidote protein VapI